MLKHKAASYAVASMVDLARRYEDSDKSGEVRAHSIAERYDLPVSYTAKILSQLAKASLLNSGRGPQGGFSLARSPREITLLDIFEAVGAMSHGDVELASGITPAIQRNLDQAVDQAMKQAKSALAELSLADLMHEGPASGQSHESSGSESGESGNYLEPSRPIMA